MRAKQVTTHGDFQIATIESRTNGFIAWAKMGRIVGSNPIDEPGEHVWFEFGPSRDAARARLMNELWLRE